MRPYILQGHTRPLNQVSYVFEDIPWRHSTVDVPWLEWVGPETVIIVSVPYTCIYELIDVYHDTALKESFMLIFYVVADFHAKGTF